MNIQGVLIGAASFLIIGIFHPIVVKAEYHFGTRIWPLFLLVGLAAVGISLFVDNLLVSAILGVFGFSCLWSIREVFEQQERVKKGWFPGNPNR
ncbi:MAG: DUF4491 family protein [Anaerolineales bacterium]|nr:DUF4491 family protein [Anaerolineales bacterium]